MGTSVPSAAKAGRGRQDWRNIGTGSALPQRLGYILESGLFSDVSVIVGEKRKLFNVHKIILRIGSRIFDELFEADEGKTSFGIPDLEPEEFSLLLKVCVIFHFEFTFNWD